MITVIDEHIQSEVWGLTRDYKTIENYLIFHGFQQNWSGLVAPVDRFFRRKKRACVL
jgi:hypothetical protein